MHSVGTRNHRARIRHSLEKHRSITAQGNDYVVVVAISTQ
jgi:hypothetical protein